MKISDAIELLRNAIGNRTGTWADLGAGTGTFTRALGELLDPGSTVYAVDDDARAVRALGELSATSRARVVPVKGDFTAPLDLPGLGDRMLDGILLANALHFVREPEDVLTRLVAMLRPGGQLIVVEYDRRAASRWVPYPIPASRWPQLAAAAGVTNATITATRPSEYSGILYVGAATRQ